ncbi:MAG: glycosyltransferase family 4 protein [Patescibacteria group bacterium]|nr:glycosyltransferase family 4 protein [Patescibacteria group bacterium]
MKIALVSPIEETVPPILYGGIEWIIYYLASGLGKKKHNVYLLTTANSEKKGNYNIIPIYHQSIRKIEPYKSNIKIRENAKFIAISKTLNFLIKEKFDIIHNHASWRFLLFEELFSPQKFLTTLHGPMNFDYQNFVFLNHQNSYYISISNNQRRDLPQLNYIKTIYNATDVNYLQFKEKNDENYLLFFARFSKEKGPDKAIETIKKTKKRLLLATKVDKNDQEFFNLFENELKNNPLIDFKGEVGLNEKLKYYQNAKALLLPIMWEEPFGLMFIESMACGTPVVAFARGSVPEVIKDGETGFIVNPSDDDIRGDWIIKKTGIEGLCEAVERIYSMSEKQYLEMRRACRAHVEKHFTVERMVDEYEKVYNEIINNTK